MAVDGQGILVVVHHAEEQFGADARLWCPIGDAVHRCLWLEHHIAIHHILDAQMNPQPRIRGLQTAPGLDAAGADTQMVGRIAILQQVQVPQLGVGQQGQDIVVDVLRRYRELAQIEKQAHMHDGAMHCRHIHQVEHAHFGAAAADDLVQQMVRLEALQHKVNELQCVQIGQAQHQLLEALQQLAAGAEQLDALGIVGLRHVAGEVIDQRSYALAHANQFGLRMLL